MKQLILLFISAILIYFIFENYSSKSKQEVFISNVDKREKLFNVGTEQELRNHFEAPKSKIHYGDLWSLIDRNRNDLLEILLGEYKVDPDIAKKYHSDTALLHASENLKPESVELLIRYGADLNYKNKDGKTALLMVAYSYENLTLEGLTPDGNDLALKITQLLVEAGADVNLIGDFDETAIKGALLDNDLERVKYLIESGGDVFQIDRDGANYLFYCNNIDCIEFFVNQGLSINSITLDGKNLLQNGVYTSLLNIDTLRGMLNLGVDICHVDNDGLNITDHAMLTDISPHLKNDNLDFYNKKIEENVNGEIYKFLEEEFLLKCNTEKN